MTQTESHTCPSTNRSTLANLTDAAESLCEFLLAHHLTAAGSDACVELLGRIAAAQEVLDSD